MQGSISRQNSKFRELLKKAKTEFKQQNIEIQSKTSLLLFKTSFEMRSSPLFEDLLF